MEFERKLIIQGPEYLKYKNDVFHPCVRYVKEGFYGHNWWMVQSPYYNSDDLIENPILFYGDSTSEDEVPSIWTYVDIVKDTPLGGGYNSDPNLLFKDGKLYVIWREFQTLRVKEAGLNSAIYMVSYDSKLVKSEEIYLFGESSATELTDISPVLFIEQEQIVLFSIHYSLDCSSYRLIHKIARKILSKLNIMLYYDHTVGVKKWTGSIVEGGYSSKEMICFRNRGKRKVNPWHFDLVDYKGYQFLLLYDSNYGNNLFIGYYDSSTRQFVILEEPLLKNIYQYTGGYKPTGVVIGDFLYLFHTACTDVCDRKKHELWLSTIDLRTVITYI